MSARVFIILFCVVLALPSFTQLGADLLAKRPPLAAAIAKDFRLTSAHLSAFETRLEEEWPIVRPMREWVQCAMLITFREGNEKVLTAPNGWLVYRPGLSALLGAGPLGNDVRTVAKPPPAIRWLPPLDAIKDFARQLRARGIDLVFAPVPDKAAVHPWILSKPATGPVRHRDMAAFEQALESDGIKVVRLTELFASAPPPLYLKTDTHWNRAGLDIAISAVASALGRTHTAPQTEGGSTRAGRGDLAAMLAGQRTRFAPETAGVWESAASREPKPGERGVLVLGDSFVNIYRDPALGFGADGGFAELLEARLGVKVDVIALNGGAATLVRSELARKPELLEGKQAVVWVVAERELSPAPPSTRTESVVWSKVAIPAARASVAQSVDRLVITAKLEQMPAYLPPGEAPYRSCLGVMLYSVSAIKDGVFEDKTIPVVHWIFKDDKLLPPSAFVPGAVHTLELAPFDKQPATIQNIQRVDDTGDTRRLWWVENWQ